MHFIVPSIPRIENKKKLCVYKKDESSTFMPEQIKNYTRSKVLVHSP